MGHGASVSRSGSSVWQQEEDPEWNDFSQITVAPEALHFWSRRHGISEEDARILWHRFKLLEPDDEGFISRDAFRKPPYSTNAFSKQIWARIPGQFGDRNKIGFDAFLETMSWWQTESLEKKLDVIFNFMSRDGTIREEILCKVFRHAKDDISQEEIRDLSTRSVMYMKEDSTSGNTEGPIGGVSLNEFKHYILQSSTSQLEDLLNFKIQDFDFV